MACPKYFRVVYEARLHDGRCFRPLTWTVLNGVRTAAAAARVVDADTVDEARMWHGIECVVTVHRVVEATAAEYTAHIGDARMVIELALLDPGMIEREAAQRGELPTVVAERWKQAAAHGRTAAESDGSNPSDGRPAPATTHRVSATPRPSAIRPVQGGQRGTRRL
jgi:hypothetical protein